MLCFAGSSHIGPSKNMSRDPSIGSTWQIFPFTFFLGVLGGFERCLSDDGRRQAGDKYLLSFFKSPKQQHWY